MGSKTSNRACVPVSYRLNLTPATAASLSRGGTECAKPTAKRTYAVPYNKGGPINRDPLIREILAHAYEKNEAEICRKLGWRPRRFWEWRQDASPKLYHLRQLGELLGYELVWRKKT